MCSREPLGEHDDGVDLDGAAFADGVDLFVRFAFEVDARGVGLIEQLREVGADFFLDGRKFGAARG